MPILVSRQPVEGVNWIVFAGRVTPAQLLAFPDDIDPSSGRFGTRWLTFMAPDADLSELTLDSMHALKPRLAPVILALSDQGVRMAIVSHSPTTDPVAQLWGAFARTDEDYPGNPKGFRSIEDAAAYLSDDIARAGPLADALTKAVTAAAAGAGRGLSTAPA